MTEALGNCSGCGRQWNALGQAHCAQCHRHFSGDTAFDLHLGKIPESGPPPCKDPAKVRRKDGTPRMVERDGIWGWPERDPEHVAKKRRADSERRPAAVGTRMGSGGGGAL